MVNVATLMGHGAHYDMGRFDQLIGPDGELRILLHDDDILLDDELCIALAAEGAGQGVSNVAFGGNLQGFGNAFAHI